MSAVPVPTADADSPADRYLAEDGPSGLFTRLTRVGLLLESFQHKCFDAFGLRFIDYSVLRVLHLADRPYRMSPSELTELLLRSSGGMTQILDRLATLSLSTWNGKGADPRDRHLGPMAQDFHALFGLGTDDTKIASADLSGVGLAAIQGLYQRLRVVKAQAVEQQATIDAQQNDIAELKRRVDELQTLRAELTALRQAVLEPM